MYVSLHVISRNLHGTIPHPKPYPYVAALVMLFAPFPISVVHTVKAAHSGQCMGQPLSYASQSVRLVYTQWNKQYQCTTIVQTPLHQGPSMAVPQGFIGFIKGVGRFHYSSALVMINCRYSSRLLAANGICPRLHGVRTSLNFCNSSAASSCSVMLTIFLW